MSTYDRDETTRAALQQSSAWQRIVGKSSLLILAKAGPLELESLSDADHEEIRAWALGGGSIESAPTAVMDYFRKLDS